jgi:hypothetical protein
MNKNEIPVIIKKNITKITMLDGVERYRAEVVIRKSVIFGIPFRQTYTLGWAGLIENRVYFLSSFHIVYDFYSLEEVNKGIDAAYKKYVDDFKSSKISSVEFISLTN